MPHAVGTLVMLSLEDWDVTVEAGVRAGRGRKSNKARVKEKDEARDLVK